MRKIVIAVLLTILVVFPLGLFVGFGLGVYSTDFGKRVLMASISEEAPAAVDRPHRIERQRFRLQFPGNWTVDAAADDYDADHNFAIDTPGLSYVAFFVLNVYSDPREDVEEQVEYFDQVLSNTTQQRFDRWGRYDGYGIKLSGRYFGDPSEIRIFSHSRDDFSFTVIEFFDTASLLYVKPGYNLVEQTFEIKPFAPDG